MPLESCSGVSMLSDIPKDPCSSCLGQRAHHLAPGTYISAPMFAMDRGQPCVKAACTTPRENRKRRKVPAASVWG